MPDSKAPPAPQWNPNPALAAQLLKALGPSIDAAIVLLATPETNKLLQEQPETVILSFDPKGMVADHPLVAAIKAYRDGAMDGNKLTEQLRPYLPKIQAAVARTTKDVTAMTMDESPLEIVERSLVTLVSKEGLSGAQRLDIIKKTLGPADAVDRAPDLRGTNGTKIWFG